MTIGIAAYGPRAGEAVVKALAAVEREARGAIGGFVSLVGIDGNGDVLHDSTQVGGSKALFGGSEIPGRFLQAEIAGLMSSGPNRPEPLSQFTPASGRVGLVTGHRLPNVVGANGIPMNRAVLNLMADGLSTKEAVDHVVGQNGSADAGFLALGTARDLYLCNTPAVDQRADKGRALLLSDCGQAGVGVLHNAIHPHNLIASLASEIAMDAMMPPDEPQGWIRVNTGIPLRFASETRLLVDGEGIAQSIHLARKDYLVGRWSIGLGDRVPVYSGSGSIGRLAYEPFMIIEDGRLVLLDGESTMQLPVIR